MCVYFKIFGMEYPAYGCMIAAGLVIASVIGIFGIGKKHGINPYDYLIMECYCFLFGLIGAKLLYLIVSFKQIDWSRMKEPEYFAAIMNGGFVFYGGLILGLVGCLVGGKIHKIDTKSFARHAVFMVPMIHAFGRVGCFCAGCCYGIPYTGRLAVVFPENPLGGGAPAGIPLFPVQLVEAACLLIIAGILMLIDRKGKKAPTLSVYLVLYAILRFVLEKYRFDSIRGIYGGLSTSQWISIGMIILGIILFLAEYVFAKKERGQISENKVK